MRNNNKVGQWNIISFTKKEVEYNAVTLVHNMRVAFKKTGSGSSSWLNLDFTKLLTEKEIEEIQFNERNIIDLDRIFNGKKSISTKKLVMLICPEHIDFYNNLIN